MPSMLLDLWQESPVGWWVGLSKGEHRIEIKLIIIVTITIINDNDDNNNDDNNIINYVQGFKGLTSIITFY